MISMMFMTSLFKKYQTMGRLSSVEIVSLLKAASLVVPPAAMTWSTHVGSNPDFFDAATHVGKCVQFNLTTWNEGGSKLVLCY